MIQPWLCAGHQECVAVLAHRQPDAQTTTITEEHQGWQLAHICRVSDYRLTAIYLDQ
jgi:hypothetical protein